LFVSLVLKGGQYVTTACTVGAVLGITDGATVGIVPVTVGRTVGANVVLEIATVPEQVPLL